MSSLIHHSRWGSGPAIVLVHGLFGSLENLGIIARQLKDDYSVYAIDLPGHARSGHLDDISLASMADTVVNWMDSIDLPQAHFLGHSLGGKVSMEIALRHPEKINKLIVADIAPVSYPRRHDDVFTAFGAVDLNAISSRGDADKVMKQFVDVDSVRSFLLKNLEKNDGHWQWKMDLDGLEQSYEKLIAGNTLYDASFERPVLFIKGEQSDYILPEHQEKILELFPLAEAKIIHGTEHWLHVQKPDIFAHTVKRFLAK